MATTHPDATTTGVPSDVTLQQSGSLVITTPGAVIEGLDIRGSVVIDAPNVTLKNCKITDSSFDVVLIKPGITGAVVQNCEIDNQGVGGQGIAGQGTFVSNNIHGCADGIDVRGDNTVIRDNFIHDMQGTSESHYDGIQADGGFSNLTISHNTVINEKGQTSAIMLDNYWGPIDNVTIDDNLLIGGGYTTYLQESSSSFWGGGHGGHPITNVTYSNNHVGGGQWGDLYLASDLGHSPTMTNNTQDGEAMLASLQMDGQPSSSVDVGTGVSDPAPSTSDDSGTDSHDSGPVASADPGSDSSGSDGASTDPGSSSSDSSADAGSADDAGTGVSDPAPSTSDDSGTDSHDSGPVASADPGSDPSGSDGVSGNSGSTSDDLVTSPGDQNSSSSGSDSHHGRWHRSDDSASADPNSTDNGSHSQQGNHWNHDWWNGKDGSGGEKAAATNEADAGPKHVDAGQKTGDSSHHFNHDSFAFGSRFHDAVEKLQQRASQHDFGQFSKNMYDHLADVLNHAARDGQDGGHAGASGDAWTFKDGKVSNHHHNDFHFS